MSSEIILGLFNALRYRALPQLVGLKVVINGVADIEAQVMAALTPDIPASCRLACNPASLDCMVAKGYLDLTFLAPNDLLDSEYASGVTVLQELRLIYPVTKDYLVKRLRDRLSGIEPPPTLGIPGYVSDGDLTPSCYEALLEESLTNQAVIRLFLRGEHPCNLAIQWELKTGAYWDGITIPDGYFPHCYDVEDACIANAQLVWMSKHWHS